MNYRTCTWHPTLVLLHKEPNSSTVELECEVCVFTWKFMTNLDTQKGCYLVHGAGFYGWSAPNAADKNEEKRFFHLATCLSSVIENVNEIESRKCFAMFFLMCLCVYICVLCRRSELSKALFSYWFSGLFSLPHLTGCCAGRWMLLLSIKCHMSWLCLQNFMMVEEQNVLPCNDNTQIVQTGSYRLRFITECHGNEMLLFLSCRKKKCQRKTGRFIWTS